MIVGYKYKVFNKIGTGNYGSIFKGLNIRTNEEIAIKVESKDSQTKLLKHEAQIYQYIGILKGFPQMKWFGSDSSNYYMVLELLEKSLSEIKQTNIPFCFKTIAIQIIDRIESLHNLTLIHRDIKPDNFLFKLEEDGSQLLYLIDYGFCRSYLDSSGEHIKMNSGKKICGTPNFVSDNVKNGLEPSRRDDIISCVKVMLFLLDGLECDAIKKIMSHVSQLEFDELPSYLLYKSLIEKIV